MEELKEKPIKKPEVEEVDPWIIKEDFEIANEPVSEASLIVEEEELWAVELKQKSKWGHNFWVKYYSNEADARKKYRSELIDEIQQQNSRRSRLTLNKYDDEKLESLVSKLISKCKEEDYVYEISYYNIFDKISS